MELKIKRLTMKNFKGVDDFTGIFDGKNWNVYGDNETGKSTVFDAFTWVLFGKDSLGQTQFDIKPLLKSGEAAHSLESVVEVLLEHDGKELLLKRLYREIWKGKRGFEQELSGHETLTYINEEKVNVGEYVAFVGELVDENIFRILTNVYYFNGALKPEERRNILFNLIDGLTDEEIIKANPELKALSDYLPEGRTVESLIKIIKDKNKQLNKELEEYPARITTLADTPYKIPKDFDNAANDKALEEAYAKRSELEHAKTTGSNLGKISELTSAILSFENDIEALENEREKLSSKAEFEKQSKLQAINLEIGKISGQIREAEDEIANFKKRKENGLTEIDREKEKRSEIYQAYPKERDKVFIAEKCSYCGQTLPKEMVEENEKKFNLEKAKKLEELRNTGEAMSTRIEKYVEAVAGFEKEISKTKEKKELLAETLTAKIAEQEKLKDEPSVVNDAEISEKIKTAKERKAAVMKELEKVKTKEQPTLFDTDLENAKKEIERLIACRTEYQVREANKRRIENMEALQKETRAKYEENMLLLDKCDKFVVAKRNYYQNKLDANFEITSWKLYEEQLSGGIRETCIATHKGVPYSSLNNGAKINVGLDVIKTLQNIYNIKVPIFIDNAESTTKYLSLDSQVIKLYVSKPDKVLRFEEAGEETFIQTESQEKEREVS